MKAPTVLISGVGIAGPTLAYWLARHGFEPTLVESAPGLRDSGYMIDFWGAGYEVAERMALIPKIMDEGYRITEVRIVDSEGRRVSGFNADLFRDGLNNQFLSIPRGQLAKLLYENIAGRVETIFGDSVRSLAEHASGVSVEFEHSRARSFDLVVGADGLHSRARAIAFGPEKQYEQYLGFVVAAFNAPNYPRRDEDVYVSYCVPGKQVARYTLRDGRTGFFFIVRENDGRPVDDLSEGKSFLTRNFRNAGWECADIIRALRPVPELYFDRVSQIHLEHWSKGRIVLVGDAAASPSLLAGEGSGLAMAAAYVLAGELKRAAGDHAAAFRNYEALLKPWIEWKQKSATRLGGWFAPQTRLGLVVRNAATQLMNLPIIGRWAVRRMVGGGMALPEYA
jgi:2-polyprenyl-6-methoxyphenol hydroxylase-like FAD-dependent oxidoreductase